jgi:hypothetical protein
MYLVKKMAYAFAPIDLLVREDFESYAISGLIRALDSFKPHLAIPSGVHAYNWMLSYLSRMSTYPLAAALDIIKDWARARLRSVVPGEDALTE